MEQHGDSVDFWGHQSKGETGSVDYKGLNLSIEEIIGSRSRMGNTYMSVQNAKHAHCIIFCLENAHVQRGRYGVSRVLRYISSAKNEHVKLILAITKSDKTNDEVTLPVDIEEYPCFAVSRKNYSDFLKFVVTTMESGEPVAAIQKRKAEKKAAEEALLKAQEAKQSPLPAPVEANKPSFVSLKKKADKGMISKVVGLFSQGNKVETENKEIAPLA